MSSSLDPKIVNKVSKHVYQQFPEVAGVKPNIRKQTGGKKTNQSRRSTMEISNYLLTFRGKIDLGNGKKMDRWVRVVIDNRGKIIKMSTSR